MGHMAHYNGLTIAKLRGGITVSNHNDDTYVQTSLFDDLMDVLKKSGKTSSSDIAAAIEKLKKAKHLLSMLSGRIKGLVLYMKNVILQLHCLMKITELLINAGLMALARKIGYQIQM